jgi:DNA recombination protein RmuC
MEQVPFLVAASVAFVLALLWFRARSRLSLTEERQRVAEDARLKAEETLVQAKSALDAEAKARGVAESAAASSLATVEAMKAALAAAEKREGELKQAAASERGKLEKAEAARADAERLLEGERKAREREKQAFEERVEELRTLKKQMEDAFGRLSAEALSKNNEQFLSLAGQKLGQLNQENAAELEKRQQAVAELLKPMQEAIARVGQSVEVFDKGRAESFATFAEKMESLRRQEESLQRQTQTLGEALRKPGVRGAWGEMQLRRVVEFAGLQERVHFAEQVAISDADRPDMIVDLPNGLQIVVDAKAPMDAYLRALEEPDEAKRCEYAKDHARQVRDRARLLGQKKYTDQLKNVPDFTVLFLPSEALFSAALAEDPELLDFGMKSRIIIATPTTLIALLMTVASGWENKMRAENAQEIFQHCRELYERFCKVLESFGDVGKGLERAIKAYNSSVGSIQGRLIPQARKLNSLGGFDKGAEKLTGAVPEAVETETARTLSLE